MNETPNEEGIVRDGERAVATPNLAALSRHPALRVSLGFASLQRSPPPLLRPLHQIFECYASNTAHTLEEENSVLPR